MSSIKKGLKLNNQLNNLIALNTLIPKPLLELEKNLRDSLSDLINLKMINKSNPITDSTLLATRTRYDNLLQKFESQYPSYFALRYALPNADLRQVKKSIKASQAILSYFETPDKLFSLFVTSDTAFAHPHDGEIKKINSAMNDAIIKNKLALLKERAAQLQTLLINPSVNRSSLRYLIILPDGYIWNVQFTLLPGYKPNSQLGRELNISYQYAYNDYQLSEKKNKNNGKVLAFSAANLKENGSGIYYSSFRDIQGELPGTSTEVREIATVRDGDYHFGYGATETLFKSKAKDYQILHLAMHGELNMEEPNYSNLRFIEPDTLNDSRLHAFEIYSLNLAAELAVLSACNSGNGQIQEGDGIISLGRAFAFAGVSSLLLSKWEVSDVTAPLIMKYFYEGLKEGLPKSEALRLAKLKFLKQDADNITSSPYYWGSFYILGNDKPITTSCDSSRILFLSMGGIGTIAVLMLIINLRKRKSASANVKVFTFL
jgi:CHAT domain-containing protein